VLCGRVASVGVLALLFAARPPAEARATRRDAFVIAALGALDVAANLAYAAAAVGGAGAAIAVLGSLCPLTTVLLARALLRERLGSTRLAGVVGALGGIVLMSAAAE
jgi:drug/metabolite transporter (DMT)-like permease